MRCDASRRFRGLAQLVEARADDPGRVVLEREEDVLESFSRSLTEVFGHAILEKFRNE